MTCLNSWEYLDTLLDILSREGSTVTVPISGNSMCPFLHPGELVFLSLPEKKLEVGDVVLFNRPNGDYILHRIVSIRKDGIYMTLGDNQTLPEPVPPQAIRAVTYCVRRQKRLVKKGSLEWWFFAHPWRLWAGLRRFRK